MIRYFIFAFIVLTCSFSLLLLYLNPSSQFGPWLPHQPPGFVAWVVLPLLLLTVLELKWWQQESAQHE